MQIGGGKNSEGEGDWKKSASEAATSSWRRRVTPARVALSGRRLANLSVDSHWHCPLICILRPESA